MRTAAVVLAGSILSFLCLTAVLAAKDAGVQAPASAPSITSIGSYFGVVFIPLDSSDAPVSEQQAISAAMRNSFGTRGTDAQLVPGVTVSAQYGTLTDPKRTIIDPGTISDGQTYQNLPVWVIAFTGEGVGVPALGRRPVTKGPEPRVVQPSPAGATTEFVVISGLSGHFLEGFN